MQNKAEMERLELIKKVSTPWHLGKSDAEKIPSIVTFVQALIQVHLAYWPSDVLMAEMVFWACSCPFHNPHKSYKRSVWIHVDALYDYERIHEDRKPDEAMAILKRVDENLLITQIQINGQMFWIIQRCPFNK